MRLFVRLSFIGLLILVAIGFAYNQQQGNGNQAAQIVTVTSGVCLTEGTSLVVDFGSNQQKPLISNCVKNFSGYSWDLFEQADLVVSGTEKYPVGFVCRIAGFPDKQHEPCTDTPGTKNGSWAYFLSDETGAWKYSPIGASTHKVVCGVSEGWRFLLPGESIQSAPRIRPKSYACAN